ncbi:MAG TPA: helix-turn-helix transcriptional regulator [Thermoanaerobaculia bacterium]|nr:helix-turn-helix transcriptional regulator [Thermoanaerobaculia bacterium]
MAFKDIAKVLERLRRQRGLSQAQLADLCEIGRSQVSRYEAGKELMKLATLERILATLAVEPEDFFHAVGSIGKAPVPQEETARERCQGRQLDDAFRKLHSAIDELRQVVEGLSKPARRFVRLIDEAADRRPPAACGPSLDPREGRQP